MKRYRGLPVTAAGDEDIWTLLLHSLVWHLLLSRSKFDDDIKILVIWILHLVSQNNLKLISRRNTTKDINVFREEQMF